MITILGFVCILWQATRCRELEKGKRLREWTAHRLADSLRLGKDTSPGGHRDPEALLRNASFCAPKEWALAGDCETPWSLVDWKPLERGPGPHVFLTFSRTRISSGLRHPGFCEDSVAVQQAGESRHRRPLPSCLPMLACFSRMRSEGFPFISGGLGVEAVFARSCSRVRNRPQPSATVRGEAISVCHWDSSWKLLFSLALCAKRSFSKLDVSFRCADAVFWKAACSRCRATGICDPGVVALRCPAWQARHSVCAGAVFVGPVVQSARFQNLSKSFWRHSPVLVLDVCRKRVKVGFRGRSSTLDDFEFVASLLCVTGGAALSSGLVEFRGWRGTLELLVPGCRFRGRHVTLTQRDRSRCGAVHILSTRSEPSAHFGWVELVSLWCGSRFECAWV